MYKEIKGRTAREVVLSRVVFCVLTVCFLVSVGVSAQDRVPGQHEAHLQRGAWIRGHVESPNGRPLSGVSVKIQAIESGFVDVDYTDDGGSFSFTNLPPGNYSIELEAPGYQTTRQFVRLDSFPLLNLSFILKPEAGEEVLKGSYTVSVRQLQIPENARQEYRKGLEDLQRGKTDKAIEHWEKSIRIYPQYVESYLHLSKIYLEREDYSHALEMAQGAVAIDERNVNALCILGYIYLKKEDFPQAKDVFEKAVRLSDTNWLSHFWLGWLLLKENDAKDAYAPIFRARQLRPQLPEIHILYFNDLLKLGRVKEALAELDDFLERFPDHALAAQVRAKRDSLRRSLASKTH